MDREPRVCPDCGQPVDTVVKRHKTLGAWVPVWGPGPCHNPDCPSHVDDGRPPAEAGRNADAAQRPSGPGKPSEAGAEDHAL
ncbi:hypothetical protein JK359_26320 [Streptomyces actinomycinicus]|uniref:Uncharacterized protein n=1 Tax=Streptomyces actinomycinicus TaxID=1695166 RepID=A0A937EP23_9ACTN|nr:hypothetical protein [Streptomyces actinomycinicus]MBL1085439.1 hypothetical protein [Streptomyces actinomycinicus]